MVRHAGSGRVEPDRRRAHAVPAAIGLGHLVVREVQHRAALGVHGHRLAPEPGQDRSLGIGRQRQHVHPGVDAHASRVGLGDERPQRVALAVAPGVQVGVGIGEAGVIPRPAPAIDLDEEIGHAQGFGICEQTGQVLASLQDALRAFAEHPQATGRGRRRAALALRRLGWGRRARLGPGRAASQEHERGQEPPGPVDAAASPGVTARGRGGRIRAGATVRQARPNLTIPADPARPEPHTCAGRLRFAHCRGWGNRRETRA